jgi:hypothetical protein
MTARAEEPTLLGRLHGHLRSRRHSAVLVAMVVAFAMRPVIGDEQVAMVAFSAAMIALMLVALYTLHVDDVVEPGRGRRRRRQLNAIAWVLALVAIGERVLALLTPVGSSDAVAAVSWLLFFAFVIWSQLRSVLSQREITSETISMSISIYLLLALVWALVYFLIHQARPDAFQFADAKSAQLATDQLLPVFVYFSLTTISTTGFGDITPLALPARYLAASEGIVGQFYLAILVARLVGLQMSRR